MSTVFSLLPSSRFIFSQLDRDHFQFQFLLLLSIISLSLHSSNGNTARAERALIEAFVRLNTALHPLRVEHDAKAAASGADFQTWCVRA